jgi:hypothetical protein
MKTYRIVILLLVVFCAATLCFAQNPCDKLKSLSLPDSSVTAAEFVPAGLYSAPSAFPGTPAPKAQADPSSCRLTAVYKGTGSKNDAANFTCKWIRDSRFQISNLELGISET